MRPFVYRLARESGVCGRVRNDTRGVAIEAFAGRAALDAFESRLRAERPPAARVREVLVEEIPPEEASGFVIVASEGADERRVTIPPDLATCPACLLEVRDPRDRRHRYPFTNCTDCGPRFTIAIDVPYDRAATTMAPFRMCPACQREYQDPSDRRFHAEPNACPRCGPIAFLAGPDGAPRPGPDPVGRAGAALAAGLVVAVKGIGGFHLACDALSSEAVRRLRERKRREEKPLAVMARSVAEAEETRRPLRRRARAARLRGASHRARAAPARLRPCRRGGARQPARGPRAPLRPPPPPAPRERRASAGDDLGQPLRGTHRLRERRGAAASQRHRRPLPAARPGHRHAGRRLRGAGDRGPSRGDAAVARVRAAPGRSPAPAVAADARVRCPAQEHLLPRRRRRGHARAPHRRSGEPGDARVLRAGGGADGAVPAATAGADRPRPPPGLPLDPLCARARRRRRHPGRRRAAPPRPRGGRHGRARPARARARAHLGRGRARDRRDALGRRAPARALPGLRAGGDAAPRSASRRRPGRAPTLAHRARRAR